MHGSGGEQRKQWQYMFRVHSNSKTIAADLSASEFFLKDGRKIHVGDCALFKPPLDSPPFIGVIRRVKADKDNSCCLDVNWLYRPAEIKLTKGVLSDAAPNEVFYSFHQDEIPAASLLHPCKVAFLCKGVELPSGISSFVCRRVYDTDHKCLWWLTDKDYTDERQEEVDRLLDKTRQEMQGAVPSGDCSPKPLNGPASVVQPKPCTDSVHNSSSLTSHVKLRKRERVDQGSEPCKRVRLFEAEDGESGQENTVKHEISKITDQRGIVDVEGVEKLIKLMQMNIVNKEIDLAGRIMLVNVISATDRLDCISWFLQLKGLLLLDEWLQEVHKGKICEGGGPNSKESDKSIDEFLFSLLHALEKLPVNLHALQTCNVGKSVNHLRTHKNYEIQRKARSLVDTWKKRVEAEMNDNDVKSCSSHGAAWPTKPVLSEVSNIGSKKSGVSAEGGPKSLTTRAATPRNSQVKLDTTEIIAHSSISPRAIKSTESMTMSSMDQSFRAAASAGGPDFPTTPIKDEKSSSSSQSQNNSQSSDYAKTVASSHKEDGKSLAAGSGNKVLAGASRHLKSTNGHHIANISAVQKESISGKITASSRNLISEKFSSGSQDKLSNSPLLDHGNNRLIVRLPNTSRSPIRTDHGSSPKQPVSSYCRNSLSAECPDFCDNKVTGNVNVVPGNTATDGNSNIYHQKEKLHESEDGVELSARDQPHASGDDDEVPIDPSTSASLSTEITSRAGKSYEASLSSMNALIESCAKFSECSASPGDEAGMNLLATVAAEEISKSSNMSLLDSPGRNSHLTDNLILHNSKRLNLSCEEVAQTKFDVSAAECMPSEQITGGETENKYGHHATLISTNSFEDKQCSSFSCSRSLEDCCEHLNSSSSLLQLKMDGSDSNLDVLADPGKALLNSGQEGNGKDIGINNCPDQIGLKVSICDKVKCSTVSASKLKHSLHLHEHKKVDHADTRTAEIRPEVDSEGTTTQETNEVYEKALCPSSDLRSDNETEKELTNAISSDKVSPLVSEISSGILEEKSEDTVKVNESGNLSDESLFDRAADVKFISNAGHIDRQMVNVGSNISELRGDCVRENMKKTDFPNCSSHATTPDSPLPLKNDEQIQFLNAYKTDDSNLKKASVSSVSSLLSGSDPAVKLNFDLNEGFSVDDTNQEEVVNHADAGNSFAHKISCPLPFFISAKSGAFPASITVASAAKGPVVPPENLLRINGELRWKGSAATSAFRPAEPRKNLEMPLSMSDSTSVTTVSKQESRPPLDFDLNEPDERLLEEISFQSAARATCDESGPLYPAGGRDLDLNSVEEISDLGLLPMGSGGLSTLQSSSLRVTHGGVNVSRDFDLNNGPCDEEVGTELISRYQKNKNIVPFPSIKPSSRMNSEQLGNFSSWFPPENYSAITAVPSIFPGRGDQSLVAASGSLRLLVPPAVATPFAAEMYRGPVLSSSSLSFQPATQYPAFSFDTSFSLSSSSFSGCSTEHMDSTSGGSLCYPSNPSQVVRPTGLVSTPYPRPYVMSFPGGGTNVGPDIGKWGNLCLDLNTGPGGMDADRRDERFASSLKHFPGPNAQSLVDEPRRMFQVGGVLKRKDPDTGLDVANGFSSKQPSRP